MLITKGIENDCEVLLSCCALIVLSTADTK